MQKKLLMFLGVFVSMSGFLFAAPPTAPSQASLTVTNASLVDGMQTPASLHIAWQDNSSNELGFTVSLFAGKPGQGVTSPLKTLSALANATSIDTTLVGTSTSVYAEVRSYVNGEASAPVQSSAVSLGSAPLAPSLVQATLSIDSAFSYGTPSFKGSVSWKDNTTNEVGYSITPYYVVNGVYKPVFSYSSWFTPANASSYTISSTGYPVIPATTTPIAFVVSVYNAFGVSQATSTPQIYASTPLAPSDITVAVTGNPTVPAFPTSPSYVPVTVSWKDNATNETSYSVVASYNNEPVTSLNAPLLPTCIALANATSCTFSTTGMRPIIATTSPVTFTVTAYNALGEARAVSAPQVLASTPLAPTSVDVKLGSSTAEMASVTVSWSSVVQGLKPVVSFFYRNGLPVTLHGMMPSCSQGLSTVSCIASLPATTTQMYATVSLVNGIFSSSATKSSLFSTKVDGGASLVSPVKYVYAFPYQTSTKVGSSTTRSYKVYVYYMGGDITLPSKISRYIVSSGQQKLQYSWVVPKGTSAFTDSAVTPGNQYAYEVMKVNGSQNSVPVKSSVVLIPKI